MSAALSIPVCTPDEWDAAMARYNRLRAYSDGLPVGHDEADLAVDAYCEAMDALIHKLPAPTLEALEAKIGLLFDRYEGQLCVTDILPDLLRDVQGLMAVQPDR